MTDEGTKGPKTDDSSSSEIASLADLIADAMQSADEREQDAGSFQDPSDDTGEFEPIKE